jgi:3-carboxy-cis,cis-muconate cycloisomerase
MPHKRNPIACSLTLAAANRVPGLVASFLVGMTQEHERGAGGWQAEWATIARVIEDTGLALASMTEVAEGWSVDASRMRANIEATGGLIFTERAMLLLGPKMGRDAAHQLLEEATRHSKLGDVLEDYLSPEEIRELNVPESYLGSAETFRRQLLTP